MNLSIKETLDTPFVSFMDGKFIIEGRSITEDVFSFYGPIEEWVVSYCNDPLPETIIEFFIEYSNSCSNKFIHDILSIFDKAYKSGHKFKIVWKYETDDDSLLQLGKDICSLYSIPYSLLEVEEVKRCKNTKVRIKHYDTGVERTISMHFWETIKRNGYEDDYDILEIMN